MKNSNKTLLISCIGIFTLALLGYQYFGQANTSSEVMQVAENSDVEVSQTISEPVLAEKQQSTEVEKSAESTKRLTVSDNTPQPGKKHYDDEWCSAKDELSETDYRFAQTELRDWHLLQGKARSNSPNSSHVIESLYPNHEYLESYEALPIEQLQSLAVQGDDKWAMVAFVQHPYAKDEVKNKVAKKLLVIGASYYALEQLVINSLVSAKTSIRLHGANQKAIDHVVDALAYAYWGIEQYNDGGLGPFIAITADEPFKTKLPIELVLARSEKAIQDRLADLKKWIQEERTASGIETPIAPNSVRKLFAENVAIRENRSKEQLEQLRRLNISTNERIMNTPCVEKILADIKEKNQ